MTVSFATAPSDLNVYCFELLAGEAELARCSALLSREDRARAVRFHFAADRAAFIIAHARLREILAGHMGCAPAELVFGAGPFGKPEVRSPRSHAVHFNLSRSGGLGAVVVHRTHPVGVDLESVRPFMHASSIAARLFSPDEQRSLGALPREEATRGFFQCWTAKEAVVKSIGRGLSHPLDSFTVPVRPNRDSTPITLNVDGRPVICWLHHVAMPDARYCLCVATAARGCSLRLSLI